MGQLGNNKPFNQFQENFEKKMPGKWFRRHIILDHRHKEILVQIMWDGHGELKSEEYTLIKKGEWWRYAPKGRIDEYRKAIASGYTVHPVVFGGDNDGEDHTVLQIIELTNTRNVIYDHTLKPVPGT